jgi:hypothetical protein
VRCTRLNKEQQDGLNDEKIICDPRHKLIEIKMPGLAPGIFHQENALVWRRRQKDRDNSGV